MPKWKQTSDYEANRSTLLQWLNNDPNAFDWTHIFKRFVVNLEGKSEEEVPIRAELVRKVVKAVVPCDVNQDPPIPTQYVDQYDIVTDFLCLVSACATTEDYTAALVRLHALVESGGKIVLYTSETGNAITPVSYPVGPYNFFGLCISRDVIFKSLEQVGFHDVKTMVQTREDLGLPDNIQPDVVAFSFIIANWAVTDSWATTDSCSVNCRVNFHRNNHGSKWLTLYPDVRMHESNCVIKDIEKKWQFVSCCIIPCIL